MAMIVGLTEQLAGDRERRMPCLLTRIPVYPAACKRVDSVSNDGPMKAAAVFVAYIALIPARCNAHLSPFTRSAAGEVHHDRGEHCHCSIVFSRRK